MEKELQQTLGQVTMYSKMGRYISNKILKYNKSSSPTQHIAKVMAPPPYQYLKAQKNKQDDESDSKLSRGSFSLENRFGRDEKKKLYMTQPPVGYYKVNHTYIDKNVHQYNFDRSVPHFERQKFSCQESKTVMKDFPDISNCKPATHGFKELKRMTGRQNEKASVRRFLEDPHENRYILVKDPRSSIENQRSRTNIRKNLGRGNQMFKSAQFTPDYSCNVQIIKKRLNTHGIPFQYQLVRDNEFLDAKTGISECFQSQNVAPPESNVQWKKVISRQKTGLLPTYMDKNIHSRMNLTQLNLKQLQMNCSNLKRKQMKNKGKKKKSKKIQEYIEEDWEKENY